MPAIPISRKPEKAKEEKENKNEGDMSAKVGKLRDNRQRKGRGLDA